MRNFFIFFLIFTAAWLAADDNFKWSLADGRIALQIADKCYLYRAELKITAKTADGRQLNIKMPPALDYNDEFFGKVQIYPAGNYFFAADSKIAAAQISYQGCRAASGTDSGTCFMPQDIELGSAEVLPDAKNSNVDFLNGFRVVAKHEGTLSIDGMLNFLDSKSAPLAAEKNWWDGKSVLLILFLLLGGGFLLNFTPCILPMIPINLAIIGAGGEKTVLAGFLRGVYYAAGMTCAYGALGLAAILSGARFGELNSSMYFNWIVAVIFFALALAMAGVWNLDFSARLNSINPMKWKIARPVAIFLMGATAALLGGACVAPAVIGMLLLAVSVYKNSPAAGLAVPFVFGIGMGILWIAAGATMGKILPKPGKWMVYVKNILAVFIALFGVYYAWTGFTLIPGRFNAAEEVTKLHETLENTPQNRRIFIDFWATWCKNCSYMERNVLSSPQVKTRLQNFVVVKFQAENLKNPQINQILKHYNIQGLPALVILEKK